MNRNRIKTHFEEEAKEYDSIILRLIPNYNQMVNILVSLLSYNEERPLKVIDLGCGTGTISQAVKRRFPNIQLTCVDIAQNMLDIAFAKNGENTRLIQADFADFNEFIFPNRYDIVVSSLAIHHLESNESKLKFYKSIYTAMNKGGTFVNIDVVVSDDPEWQKIYMREWEAFMRMSTPQKEIDEKWLPTYYAEDRPTSLLTHIDLLRTAGFNLIDVAFKYYNYAVYCAKK